MDAFDAPLLLKSSANLDCLVLVSIIGFTNVIYLSIPSFELPSYLVFNLVIKV